MLASPIYPRSPTSNNKTQKIQNCRHSPPNLKSPANLQHQNSPNKHSLKRSSQIPAAVTDNIVSFKRFKSVLEKHQIISSSSSSGSDENDENLCHLAELFTMNSPDHGVKVGSYENIEVVRTCFEKK